MLHLSNNLYIFFASFLFLYLHAVYLCVLILNLSRNKKCVKVLFLLKDFCETKENDKKFCLDGKIVQKQNSRKK